VAWQGLLSEPIPAGKPLQAFSNPATDLQLPKGSSLLDSFNIEGMDGEEVKFLATYIAVAMLFIAAGRFLAQRKSPKKRASLS